MIDLKGQIPDFQSIMLPMLKLLEDGNSKTLNEVMKFLASHNNLGEEHLKIKVPSGQMGLFRNRVGWTRSYLKNAGLIHYPSRGVYQITDFGKDYLKTNPKDLRIKHLKKMPKYKEWTDTFNQEQNDQEDVLTNKDFILLKKYKDGFKSPEEFPYGLQVNKKELIYIRKYIE